MRTMFLDIETAPDHWWQHKDWRENPPPLALETIAASNAHKSPPKNYGEEAAAKWRAKLEATERADAVKWWADRSLNSKFGQVVVVAMKMADADAVGWIETEEKEGDERRLLVELGEHIARLAPDVIVAFNGSGFDFPFLWERATIWGVTETARLFYDASWRIRQTLNLPRQHPTLVDARDVWQTVRRRDDGEWIPKQYTRGRLVDLARMSGIEVHDDSSGRDVLDQLCRGEIDKVVAHSVSDVDVLANLWQERIAPSIGL